MSERHDTVPGERLVHDSRFRGNLDPYRRWRVEALNRWSSVYDPVTECERWRGPWWCGRAAGTDWVTSSWEIAEALGALDRSHGESVQNAVSF